MESTPSPRQGVCVVYIIDRDRSAWPDNRSVRQEMVRPNYDPHVKATSFRCRSNMQGLEGPVDQGRDEALRCETTSKPPPPLRLSPTLRMSPQTSEVYTMASSQSK